MFYLKILGRIHALIINFSLNITYGNRHWSLQTSEISVVTLFIANELRQDSLEEPAFGRGFGRVSTAIC
jgi:hypothetical protein